MAFNQVIDKKTNNSSNNTKNNSKNNEQVPKGKLKSNNIYRSKETKNEHRETLIDTAEEQLFEAKNIKRFRSNLT